MYKPELALNNLKDIINDEDGLLKEALKTGDMQEVVETVSAVCSILNYMSRQDGLSSDNATEAETAAIQDERNTREEVCGTIVLISLHGKKPFLPRRK